MVGKFVEIAENNEAGNNHRCSEVKDIGRKAKMCALRRLICL